MIDIDDSEGPGGKRLGDLDYEALIADGDSDYDWPGIEDEWQAIALSYTSGTTGDPKGVVYHARGVYIETLGNAVTWAMPHRPVYLWTLPMFHALGWCFPVERRDHGRHPCRPAQGRGAGDIPIHRRQRRHPYVRGADCAFRP